MAPDPAERFAVKPTQVAEPHAADGQHRLAVATPDFETPVLTLKTQAHPCETHGQKHTHSHTNKPARPAARGCRRFKKWELIAECVWWHLHPSDCSAGFTLNERFVKVCELTRPVEAGGDYSFYCMFTWPAIYLQKKKVTSVLIV